MKVNMWTMGLAAAGLVSIPSVLQAEEKLNQVFTALSSTTISGYVDTSAQWNLGTGNANAPAFGYNSGKQDGFNLNVVKLTIERPLDESQWAAGYKVDLLFGPDANLLASQSNVADGAADFAVKQAYVALRAPVGNGLDFKVGVFDTIIGYETFESGNNPNYTRSYGYTIEPTTHTGVLMSYQFNEMFSASVGIANTFGPTINQKAQDTGLQAESYKTYMGSIAFTAPEDWGFMAGSTLYAGVINGFNAGSIRGGADQTSYYIGGTLATPIEGLRLGASYDYLGISDQTRAGVDVSSGYANAVALYASFQATEKLSLHGRGEYFSITPSADGTATGSTVPAGLASKIFAYTATVQYDLWQNVISRLEFRWDHQAGGAGRAFGGKTAGDGSDKNAFMLAANIIYKF